MKHFLETTTNEIYAFEDDDSQDFLITDTMKELTDDELKELRKPTDEQVKEANKQTILSQIAELEASQARPLRELLIDSTNQVAKSKLESIDAQIAELRKQLP